MQHISKKYKATAALAVSIAGAAGTASLAQSGFLGGMVHNGFLASTVGGLADWFAVTALFRKPLGISYRTEIIVRNRQRIMQAVVDFAANDLLASANIMKFVRAQDMAGFLGSFAKRYGEEKLLPYVERIAALIESELSAEDMARRLAPALHEMVGKDMLGKIASDVLAGLSDMEQSRRLLHVLAEGTEELVHDEGLKRLLAENIEELLHEYGDAVSSRAFLMGMLGLSGEKLAEQLVNKGSQWLRELTESKEAETRAAEWLSEKLKELAESQQAVGLLAELLGKKLTEDRLQDMLQSVLDGLLSKGVLSQQIVAKAQEYVARFIADAAWQQRADAMVKDWLARELDKHHDVIADMIAERLGELSDEELVRFTESKVADDLQMIRINGSVVGGLVGMGLYAVVYLAGQVLVP